ncbi:hypothetical protein V2W45_1416683 [Cenococcum geophilum]
MPDSNALRSLDPGVTALLGATDASDLLDHDVVGGLSAAPESEKPGHYQSGRESLDGGGTDHATSVVKTSSALNGSFDGNSLEFPLILESDAAEEHHSPQVNPSNGASDYQGNGYHAAAGTEGYRTRQHGDLDAGNMRVLFKEGHELSLAEHEPPFEVNITSRSSLTSKRTRPLSGGTIISSAVSAR